MDIKVQLGCEPINSQEADRVGFYDLFARKPQDPGFKVLNTGARVNESDSVLLRGLVGRHADGFNSNCHGINRQVP